MQRRHRDEGRCAAGEVDAGDARRRGELGDGAPAALGVCVRAKSRRSRERPRPAGDGGGTPRAKRTLAGPVRGAGLCVVSVARKRAALAHALLSTRSWLPLARIEGVPGLVYADAGSSRRTMNSACRGAPRGGSSGRGRACTRRWGLKVTKSCGPSSYPAALDGGGGGVGDARAGCPSPSRGAAVCTRRVLPPTVPRQVRAPGAGKLLRARLRRMRCMLWCERRGGHRRRGASSSARARNGRGGSSWPPVSGAP